MKKFMITAMLLGISLMAFSQTADTTTYVYCKAVSVSKNAFNLNKMNDVEISIDFGNGKVFSPDNPMKDESGKNADFDNVVDLINFLSDRKWSLDKISQLYQGSSNVKIMTFMFFKRPKYRVL
jgi:hypothetical protein